MKFSSLGLALMLSVLVLFAPTTTRAAAPVSHVVVALELIKKGKLNVKSEDIPALLRGTSFNDIRYLGVIDRKLTHTKEITWEMVQSEQDPFKKGMLLHSLLDVAREKYMVEKDIYRFIPQQARSYRGQIVKFVEDQIVYDMVSDWNSVQMAFDVIDSGERSYSIPDESIALWHSILGSYFEKQPNSEEIVTLIETLRGNDPKYKKLIPLMDGLTRNEAFRAIVLEFYQNVDQYLAAYGK